MLIFNVNRYRGRHCDVINVQNFYEILRYLLQILATPLYLESIMNEICCSYYLIFFYTASIWTENIWTETQKTI